jgi:predicted MFS family arabinose efflux permease
MLIPRLKTGVFVLEGVNAVAISLYFNYLFFYMRDHFGFSNRENLTLCAASGLLYAVGVWFAGKFAQRRGYFPALKLGFGTMGLALLAGSVMRTPAGHWVVMLVWTLGMCLTWPCLEALTSEGEPPARLARLIGIYNVVWAGGLGLAFFFGGALFEWLGSAGTFLVPAGLHAAQFGLVCLLARHAPPARGPAVLAAPVEAACAERRRSVLPPRVFLALAWVANPFAYVAMNTVIPVIPEVANRFALSPKVAGFVCSIWMLTRAVTFVLLWQWTAWHYRFRWLLGAYLAVVVGFATILLGRRLELLILSQVVFGAAVALIYYSSLYYSMDLGDTKGEHGGFHEAALGLGIFAGPAVGAASLHFRPDSPAVNAWAVTALLAIGLGWLIALRWRAGRRHEAGLAAGASRSGRQTG